MATFTPQIGKNVIETLTTGMYEDPRFIFREYIQNAADQIDEAVNLKTLPNRTTGKITIDIEPESHKVTIQDNATGISSKKVLQFLGDIANSQKDRTKAKGFRGIGRLGGLGYCEKLIFETTYLNEATKSTMSLDAKLLRKIFLDKNMNLDASQVISAITSIKEDAADLKEHYFRVILQEVTNSELLNREKVHDYLTMVAPVPFKDTFTLKPIIKKYFSDNNVAIDEYEVTLNKEQIFKAYKNEFVDKSGVIFSKLVGVDFFKVRGNNDELIGLGWYGISDSLNKQLHQNNYERGIRLKKDNISLGNENTLSKLFTETRFNLYYIGEVHAIGANFIPNGRRDYFNDNSTLQNFQNELKTIFKDFGTLAHTSSNLHNRLKEINSYKQEEEEFNNKSNTGFRDETEENRFKAKLNEAKTKAQLAKKEIEKINVKADANPNIKKLYETLIGDQDLSIDPAAAVTPGKSYTGMTLAKLNEDQKATAMEIVNIIDEIAPPHIAEIIKDKIIQKYN